MNMSNSSWSCCMKWVRDVASRFPCGPNAQLTHIEHGPHDASFYKLLAELEEEFYELKRKGYSGMSIRVLSPRGGLVWPIVCPTPAHLQAKGSTGLGTISPASKSPNTLGKRKACWRRKNGWMCRRRLVREACWADRGRIIGIEA